MSHPVVGDGSSTLHLSAYPARSLSAEPAGEEGKTVGEEGEGKGETEEESKNAGGGHTSWQLHGWNTVAWIYELE